MALHRILAPIALVLLLTACTSTPAPSTARGRDGALAGETWVLVEIVDGTSTSEPRLNSVTVAFMDDGQATFTLDCNRGRGTWTTGPGPGELRFGPLATTRAACAPGSSGDAVGRAMAEVIGYEIYDGRLTLHTSGGTQYVWDHVD